MIVVDTNVIVAAYKQDSDFHQACKRLLTTSTPLATTAYVFAEVDYLLTKYGGPEVTLAALRDIASFVMLAPVGSSALHVAFHVMEKHPEIGLTDASLVALAGDCGTTQLATMDYRHFRAINPLSGGKYFTLLPEDS